MDFKNLLKSLENRICPNELKFSNNREEGVIDWEKVRYNTFYKSNEYFESKFPNKLHKLPAFDTWLFARHNLVIGI